MTEKVNFFSELLAETEKIERTIEDFNQELSKEMLLELKEITTNIMGIINSELYDRDEITKQWQKGILEMGVGE